MLQANQPWLRLSIASLSYGPTAEFTLTQRADTGSGWANDLDRYARSLNNRPRRTLGFMKLSEKLAELFALTG